MGPRDYDRDYDAGPRLALPAMTSVTKVLLWSNIVIGVVVLLIGDDLTGAARTIYDAFALSPVQWRDFFPWLPVWQLVTYGFLHSPADPMHLLFNMLGLYLFGTWLEGIVGSRRFLVLYLASLVIGGTVQIVGSLLLGNLAPIVGASGGVLFLLVALAVMQPHTRVIVFMFPVKLRTVALIYVALDLFRLIQEIKGAGSGVAALVHLSGAAFGFVAVKAHWIWFDPFAAWEAHRDARRVEDQRSDEERLDQLLQQIHARGIGSLGRRDREFLKRMSSRK